VHSVDTSVQGQLTVKNYSVVNGARLQKEMSTNSSGYVFEIKRGEQAPPGRKVIQNDDCGRAILAFDVQEPWSAHQIYKVFDEKYAEIFGRPEVTAERVIFITELTLAVAEAMAEVKTDQWPRIA
jgi:hypothetical protein